MQALENKPADVHLAHQQLIAKRLTEVLQDRELQALIKFASKDVEPKTLLDSVRAAFEASWWRVYGQHGAPHAHQFKPAQQFTPVTPIPSARARTSDDVFQERISRTSAGLPPRLAAPVPQIQAITATRTQPVALPMPAPRLRPAP